MLTESLSSLKDAETRVTLSTTHAFGALWMVPRIKDFEERNPGFTVNVVTSTELTELSRARDVDLVALSF